MQAIITKYLSATDCRGSRIKAKCERGSITIPYPHEKREGEDTHRAAMQALINKFLDEDEKQYGTPPLANPWSRRMVTGQIPSGEYVHVFAE